jgi:transposase
MPAERLSVRKIREVVRLESKGLTHRQIGRSLLISHNTAAGYLRRVAAAGLSAAEVEALDDVELVARLFPLVAPAGTPRPLPDWTETARELKRKGVTLHLLWLEYKAKHPDGYQYTQFVGRFREWQGSADVVLRQEHKAGEKAFVDYAGHTIPIVDATTGEIRQAQIFVGTLGASNLTYVEATESQSLPDWIGSHVRMYAFFGGVPEVTVPDNLKAGVRQACYYEPDVNRTYLELARHYGTTIIPTRVAKPRDKAKVETGVQIAERWILAALRNHTFFSVAELNAAIEPLLAQLNERPFQKLEGNRRTRPACHARHQPATHRTLARIPGQSDPRRCDPRPHHPRRSQAHPEGRIHAKSSCDSTKDRDRYRLTSTPASLRSGVVGFRRNAWSASAETAGQHHRNTQPARVRPRSRAWMPPASAPARSANPATALAVQSSAGMSTPGP